MGTSELAMKNLKEFPDSDARLDDSMKPHRQSPRNCAMELTERTVAPQS